MKRPWLPLTAAGLLAAMCAVPVNAAGSGAGDAANHAANHAAGNAANHAADVPAEWTPVAESVLAGARGGFETGGGLLVSLSVDRVLSLNGNVIASGQLTAAGAALSTFQQLRVGEGSAFVQGAQPLSGLLLQNSANGQLIRGLTTIDATVNSLSILKNMHFGDSLRQSLSTAVVPR